MISFKSLANHTSGLPRLPNNLKASYSREKTNVYKKEDLDIYIKDSLEINIKTKGKFVYSNLAVGLMGYVLSKIENVGFDALYNSYIFSKYNMDNTTIDSRKSNELLVKGLSNTGNELENMYLDALAPAGSVISSVEDLAKYGLAQFDNSNNDLELIRRKTFKLNNRVSLGLGWFILKAKKNIWFNHDGNTGGYSSSMFIDVENKKKHFLMGDMLELGKHSKKLHKDMSDVLNKSKINKIHIYGKDVIETFKAIKKLGYKSISIFNRVE